MRKITIDGKEYTLKFSVAATLYNECIEAILNTFVTETKATVANDPDNFVAEVISGISNIPQKALTLFYAGLIEYHGTGKYGDKSVKSIEDARELLSKYIEENISEDGKAGVTMRGVFAQMIEIMGEDNFFEIAGLNEMAESIANSSETPKKTTRKKKTGAQ